MEVTPGGRHRVREYWVGRSRTPVARFRAAHLAARTPPRRVGRGAAWGWRVPGDSTMQTGAGRSDVEEYRSTPHAHSLCSVPTVWRGPRKMSTGERGSTPLSPRIPCAKLLHHRVYQVLRSDSINRNAK